MSKRVRVTMSDERFKRWKEAHVSYEEFCANEEAPLGWGPQLQGDIQQERNQQRGLELELEKSKSREAAYEALYRKKKADQVAQLKQPVSTHEPA